MALLKFYKLGATAMAGKTVAEGAIWFNKDEKTIEVYGANGWEKYAGSLKDATWSGEKLTITKYDGSSIELDFSGVASLAGVTNALAALKAELLGTEADGASVVSIYGVKAAVAAEASRAAAAEDKIESSVGLAQDGSHQATSGNYTSAATTVVGEIAALDSKLKEVADAVDGITGGSFTEFNAKIAALEETDATHTSDIKAINDEIDAMDAEHSITGTHVNATLTQVDGKVTVFNITESDIASATELSEYKTSNDAAVASVKATAESALPAATFNEYKTANDTEVARVAGLVDTFFEGAGMSSEDVDAYKDTLKELQEYIVSDESGAATMAENIQKNTAAIGSAKADGSEATGLYKYIDDADAVVNGNVSALAERVAALEGDSSVSDLAGRVSTNETNISELQKTVAGYDSTNTIKTAVDSAAQEAEAAMNAAESAASIADEAKTIAESKVASVSGDDYITASGTTAVSLAVNVSDITADATGLAKAKDVYDMFSWAEFE